MISATSGRCPKCQKEWTALDVEVAGRKTVVLVVWHAPRKCRIRYRREGSAGRKLSER